MTPAVDGIVLRKGAHDTREEGMCAMEAVSWLAGEKHSAAPACACPVITATTIPLNDGIADDETRTRLLGPVLGKILNTRVTPDAAGDAVLLKRMFLVVDWQVRVYAPAFLRAAGLVDAAESLESLPEIVDNERLAASTEKTSAARGAALGAARSAAENAAESAARNAARNAARDAAWSAAWSAARNAAWNAARNAAESAAWIAARNAAWSAAWSAAERSLEPTIKTLQESLAALIVRMCEVT